MQEPKIVQANINTLNDDDYLRNKDVDSVFFIKAQTLPWGLLRLN